MTTVPFVRQPNKKQVRGIQDSDAVTFSSINANSITATSGPLVLNGTPNNGVAIGTNNTAQFPNPILIGESTHATSRNASLHVGSWTIVQDISGTGVRDFGLRNLNTSNYALTVTPTNQISIGGNPGSESVRITTVSNAINRITMSGAVSGGTPTVAATSDNLAPVNLNLYGDHSGHVVINTGGASFALPNNRGTVGQVLLNDGSGSVSWSAGGATVFPLGAPDGTSTAPSINFASETGLGFNRPADNTLGIAAQGGDIYTIKKGTITAFGNSFTFGVGPALTTTSAGYDFLVKGGPSGTTTGDGGRAIIQGGNGVNGQGGAAQLIGGAGFGGNATGGEVDVLGGTGLGSNPGGLVSIQGGAGTGTGTGGEVILQGGAGNSGLNNGQVHLRGADNSDVITVDIGSASVKGTFIVNGTFSGGTAVGPIISNGLLGFSKTAVNGTIFADADGLLHVSAGVSSGAYSLPAATTTVLGGVFVPASGNLTVTGGSIGAPLASSSTFGVVKIGSGLTVSAGVISSPNSSLTPATTSSIGSIIVPSTYSSGNPTLSVDGSGNLFLPFTINPGAAATTTSAGYGLNFSAGAGGSSSGAGGALKLSGGNAVSGTGGNITISGGTSQTGTPGTVHLQGANGSDIIVVSNTGAQFSTGNVTINGSFSAGTAVGPILSNGVLGFAQVTTGGTITADANGLLHVSAGVGGNAYTLPAATTTVLGGVILPSTYSSGNPTLSIDGAGNVVLPFTIQPGAAATTTSAGYDLNFSAGASGSTSGIGGVINIRGGNSTSSTGGTVTISGGDGLDGASNAGGAIFLLGGSGLAGSSTDLRASGGFINITGGSGSSTGRGGQVAITGGQGHSTFQGGNLSLTSGNADSGTSGTVSLRTGNSSSGSGGTILIAGGTSTAPLNGSTITLQGGNANSGLGGSISIVGGTSTNSLGGSVTITPGASTSSTPGTIHLQGAGGTDIIVVSNSGAQFASNVTISGSVSAGTALGPILGNGVLGFAQVTTGGTITADANGLLHVSSGVGGSYTLPAATTTTLGGLIVPSVYSNGNPVLNVDGAGNIFLPFTIKPGAAATTSSTGYNISISGGAGGTTSGNGGNFVLSGGGATGSSTGGNVIVVAGTSQSGLGGTVNIRGADNSDVIVVNTGSVTVNGVMFSLGTSPSLVAIGTNKDLNLVPTGTGRVQFTAFSDTVNVLGNVTGATTLDTSLSEYVTATATGAVTWTFSNPAASGKSCGFILDLTNGGAFTQTWPTGTQFVGGSPPTLTVSGKDRLIISTINGGTNWILSAQLGIA